MVHACLPLSRHETSGFEDYEYMSLFGEVQVCAGMNDWRMLAAKRQCQSGKMQNRCD